MRRTNLMVVTAVCVAAAACTKPAPEVAVTPTAESTVAPQTAVSATSTMIYNAYTSNDLGLDGAPGQPGRAFLSSDKVYVGVVLHGQAVKADVKVEWSDTAGIVRGSEQTSIPVKEASVATLEITKGGALSPGEYTILVSLDDKPGWELKIDVAR